MKKFFFVLLMNTLALDMLTALCGFTVSLEADFATKVSNPAQITITSTVKYDDSHTDTEIDAVFAHSYGTNITTANIKKKEETKNE